MLISKQNTFKAAFLKFTYMQGTLSCIYYLGTCTDFFFFIFAFIMCWMIVVSAFV